MSSTNDETLMQRDEPNEDLSAQQLVSNDSKDVDLLKESKLSPVINDSVNDELNDDFSDALVVPEHIGYPDQNDPNFLKLVYEWSKEQAGTSSSEMPPSCREALFKALPHQIRPFERLMNNLVNFMESDTMFFDVVLDYFRHAMEATVSSDEVDIQIKYPGHSFKYEFPFLNDILNAAGPNIKKLKIKGLPSADRELDVFDYLIGKELSEVDIETKLPSSYTFLFQKAINLKIVDINAFSFPADFYTIPSCKELKLRSNVEPSMFTEENIQQFCSYVLLSFPNLKNLEATFVLPCKWSEVGAISKLFESAILPELRTSLKYGCVTFYASEDYNNHDDVFDKIPFGPGIEIDYQYHSVRKEIRSGGNIDIKTEYHWYVDKEKKNELPKISDGAEAGENDNAASEMNDSVGFIESSDDAEKSVTEQSSVSFDDSSNEGYVPNAVDTVKMNNSTSQKKVSLSDSDEAEEMTVNVDPNDFTSMRRTSFWQETDSDKARLDYRRSPELKTYADTLTIYKWPEETDNAIIRKICSASFKKLTFNRLEYRNINFGYANVPVNFKEILKTNGSIEVIKADSFSDIPVVPSSCHELHIQGLDSKNDFKKNPAPSFFANIQKLLIKQSMSIYNGGITFEALECLPSYLAEHFPKLENLDVRLVNHFSYYCQTRVKTPPSEIIQSFDPTCLENIPSNVKGKIHIKLCYREDEKDFVTAALEKENMVMGEYVDDADDEWFSFYNKIAVIKEREIHEGLTFKFTVAFN